MRLALSALGLLAGLGVIIEAHKIKHLKINDIVLM